jgi:hypothetical protein
MGLLSSILGNASTLSEAEIQKEYSKLFLADEKVELGFKLFRDIFIFTSKRLILIDKQGLAGKKVEF